VGRNKIVWVCREGSIALRGKGAAKQHMVRKTEKHNKRGG